MDTETTATGFEQTQIKGFNVRNVIIIVCCTASIVFSIAVSYFGLKQDISQIKSNQETADKITDLRLKIVEAQVTLIQGQVSDLQREKNELPKK